VVGRHLERIAPAVIKPREDWLQESYLVVELNEVRGEKGAALTADELLSAHGEHIAQLIRGEQTQLARMTTEHVLEGRLSYYPSDLLVVGSSAALVYDWPDGNTVRGVKTLRVKAEQLASIWLCRECRPVRSKDVQGSARHCKLAEGAGRHF